MKTLLRALLLLVVLVTSFGPGRTARSSSPALPPGVRLLRGDATGLELEWTAPPVQVRPLEDGTVEVVVEGYAQTSHPGAPRLPFASALIALPPGAVCQCRDLLLGRVRSCEGTEARVAAVDTAYSPPHSNTAGLDVLSFLSDAPNIRPAGCYCLLGSGLHPCGRGIV